MSKLSSTVSASKAAWRKHTASPPESSIYPLHPAGSRVVLRVPETELTATDRVLVITSSLLTLGSFIWLPLWHYWLWKRWKSVKNKKRKAVYAALALVTMSLISRLPKYAKVGKWLQLHKWKLWMSCLRYVAMEVLEDYPSSSSFDVRTDQAILAFMPHGIFPYSIGYAAIPELAQKAFGTFRTVSGKATELFPIVRDLNGWIRVIDPSVASIQQALKEGDRVGIIPGGIAEMFVGGGPNSNDPDNNNNNNKEYVIARKGFLRLAIQHSIPVVPIYCFGASQMLKRLHVPMLEKISRWLRLSIIVFGGVWGLPIPFRQKLLYIIGEPIQPPPPPPNDSSTLSSTKEEQQQVEEMYKRFCEEVLRIFDRHKEAYGWGHKTLQILAH